MPAMRAERRIAIVLPNPLGDVVMATPALRALRQLWPHDTLTLVGRRGALAALEGTDLADETLEDSTNTRPRWRNTAATVRRLRQRRFDLAVLLPNSFRSALLARLGRARRVVGYSRDGRGWLLHERFAQPGGNSPTGQIRYYNTLAMALGADNPGMRMELATTPADQTAARQLLVDSGVEARRPVVMLNPGAAFGPSKLWPAERFAQLADELARRCGAQIIINAAPGERAIAAQVQRGMEAQPLLSFADRDNSIGLLKGLLERCDLLVTNDTGARHFAAALGRPIVTIFGSTDPARTPLDYPLERQVVAAVPCAPCQRKQCPNPAGETFHQCMRSIGVQAVLEPCLELLAQRARERRP
jgi:heptosyltransferase-2